VALVDCIERLRRADKVSGRVVTRAVAAVSVGVVAGRPVLDLSYAEDSAADVDMNVVMTSEGKFVEIQGTAEARPFDSKDLDSMLHLAKRGIARLMKLQKEALSGK
jgi:ribonuclease PH